MDKNVTVIGLNNKDMESACILSVEGIDWEWLQENSHIAHLINFRHRSTDWGGFDTLDNTLKKEGFSLTGEKIQLEKPIVFRDKDYDMGHEYDWDFSVNLLLKCVKSPSMNIFDTFEKLCSQYGITVTHLCKVITGSNDDLVNWEIGYIRSDYLLKVAQFFGVSIDYLLGYTPPKSTNSDSFVCIPHKNER